MITLQLTDSIDVIEKRVNKAIADIANDIILKKQSTILSKCKSLINGWILSQPEIMSLTSSSSDSLAGQFGIPAGAVFSAVSSIISSIENSVSTKIVKFNEKLNGGLQVYFQPKNFNNLLTLPEGHVIYIGGDLHWLDWLIKRGDNVIVVNYQYNPQTGLGRSGLGNMIPGNSFRVPPQFSGTEDNNFITRALIGPSQEKQISNIFQEAFK